MSDTVTDEASHAQVWEYLTYAPGGERCADCRRVIGSFEPARRGRGGGTSGPPVVIYRHTDMAQCSDRAVSA